MTARTRCGWVTLRECGELLYGRRFPLKPKGAAYKSYVRPTILYGSEAWCLRDEKYTKDRKIHSESNVYSSIIDLGI